MADSNHGAAILEDGELGSTHQGEKTFTLEFGGATVGGLFTQGEYGTGWRNSNRSSPGESGVGSTEESEEEEFIADLTRKVAQSTLADCFQPPRSSKGLYSSGSPKSTLCDGCDCGQSSLCGNTNGMMQVKSHPPQTLDLLYQAAGKVANMRINQQRQQMKRVLYLQQQRPRNHLVHPCDYQESSQQRLPQVQLPQASGNGGEKLGKVETVSSSSVWPTLRQARQTRREPVSTCVNGGGTVMRAVFLGSNNVYPRGSAGTGVFLPRRAGSDPEPKRKQQGCSTVLIPEKVVQALNLNLHKMGSRLPIQPSPIHDGRYAPENDVVRRHHVLSGRKMSPRPMGSHGNHLLQSSAVQEISLPQEWTY